MQNVQALLNDHLAIAYCLHADASALQCLKDEGKNQHKAIVTMVHEPWAGEGGHDGQHYADCRF